MTLCFLRGTNHHSSRPVGGADDSNGGTEITSRFRCGFTTTGAVAVSARTDADFFSRKIGRDRVLHRRHVRREKKFVGCKFALIHFLRFVFHYGQRVFGAVYGMSEIE